jgi:elongation factor P
MAAAAGIAPRATDQGRETPTGMADTSSIRNGLIMNMDGDYWTVLEFLHVKPGKGGAFVRTKIKNLRTGRVLDKTFRSGEKVDEAEVEDKKMQFLYQDGESLIFMDQATYEQFPFSAEQLGDAKKYLKEYEQIDVIFWKGKPINIEIPSFIEAVVSHCDPGVKGDTASGATKPATIETGAVVQVPLFIKEGETIRIDTRSNAYVERVG